MHEYLEYSCLAWPRSSFFKDWALNSLWLQVGGGFTVWGLDTHDSLCRMLANSVPCVVVSVAYRSVSSRRQSSSHSGVKLADMRSDCMHAQHLVCTACPSCNALDP